MGDRLGNRIGHILFDIKQKKMIPSFAKSTENHLFRWFLSYFDTQKVGVAGFEPAASCSQSRRDNRATLHPEIAYAIIQNFIFKIQDYLNLVLVRFRAEPVPSLSRYYTPQ